jgi:hypothetical protein
MADGLQAVTPGSKNSPQPAINVTPHHTGLMDHAAEPLLIKSFGFTGQFLSSLFLAS